MCAIRLLITTLAALLLTTAGVGEARREFEVIDHDASR